MEYIKCNLLLLTKLHFCVLMLSCVPVLACPASTQCHCVETILFCVGANFTEIPYDIPHDVRHLDFHSGMLETIEADKLSLLVNLQEFTADKNKIVDIENGTFDNLLRLTKISVNENQISYLIPGLFSKLQNLKFLFLTGNMLQTVEGLFEGLTELESLHLDNNQISYLSGDTFKGLTKLYDLHINNNNIITTHPDTFTHLTTLVILNLGSNPLSNLDYMFEQNNNLHFINLTDCNFATFPAKLSSSLKYLKLGKNSINNIYRNETARYPNLVTLVIEENQLHYIEEDSFKGMKNLTELFVFVNNLTRIPGQFPPYINAIHLDSNAITAIPAHTFQPDSDILLLSICFNNIANFDSSSFNTVNSVRELKLDGNPLRILHDNIFLQVPRLKRLTLNHLDIHEIYPNCFLGLDDLHTLSMARVSVQSESNIIGNFLIHVPTLEVLNLGESPVLARYFLSHPAVMESVVNLTTLNLENNGLTTIPATLVLYLPYLYKLYLAGNPFHCSEDTFWLHEWYMMEPGLFPDIDRVFCHSPPNLQGKLIRDVTLLDFTLGHNNVSGDDMYDSTDSTSTVVIHYDDSTYYDDYPTYNYDGYDFLTFSTVTVTEPADEVVTPTVDPGDQSTTIPQQTNHPVSIDSTTKDPSNESTNFRSIALAIGMAFAVIVVMMLISVIIYCVFFRRRHNVVHHNARQNNGTNDYVFIVSKTDIQNENGAKPARKLTREERGSTTSHASQDITCEDSLKVYTLDLDQ